MAENLKGPPYSKPEMQQLERERAQYRNRDQPKPAPRPPTLGPGNSVATDSTQALAAKQKDFANARRIEETKSAFKAREGQAKDGFNLAKEKGRAKTDFDRSRH